MGKGQEEKGSGVGSRYVGERNDQPPVRGAVSSSLRSLTLLQTLTLPRLPRQEPPRKP